MPLVFALGNPGKRYAHTRHNVGYDTASLLSASFGKKLKRRCFRLYKSFRRDRFTQIVQPLTYMNNVGTIIGHFIPRRFAVTDLIVICDTLDLPVGAVRVRQGGSSAGHRGLASLIEHLGSGDFIRVYIGIGRPEPPKTVVEYVLEKPTEAQEKKDLEAAITTAAAAVTALCDGVEVSEVSARYNRRASKA